MNSILLAVLSATAIYRLELTNEKPYIVGQDGLRREVVLVSPAEYAILTGKLDQVWASFHGSENGRVQLHGSRCREVIDAENKEKITVYKDGYCHREKMAIRSVGRISAKVNTNGVNNAIMSKPANISDRHWEMRKAVLRAKQGKARQVTVEHDATTGKDTVK